MPLSKYLNGSTFSVARQPGLDHLPDVLALLHRRLGDAGQLVQRHHVADREHLRVAGQRCSPGSPRSGRPGRSPPRSCSASCVGQRRGLHAGRPDPGAGADRLLAVRALDRDRLARPSPTARVFSRISTPIFSSRSLGVALQLRVERRQHRRRALEQQDPGLARVDRAVVLRQHLVRQLGDLADQLHPGRARRRSPRTSATRPAPAGRWSSSAISNASRIRSRRWRASSTVFIPGANSANSSRPK